MLLIGFIGKRSKIEIPLGDRLEGFPFKFGQITHQPIINPLMHQEDFESFFLEDFKMGAILGGGIAFSGDVVDLLLTFLHPFDIVFKRNRLLLANVVG